MTVTPLPADLLPHADPMVLLDQVVSWDADEILCTTGSHQRPNHPLGINGELPVFCGLEYAAQAMAAHSRLTAREGGKPRQGFLVTATKVRAHVARLNDIGGPLLIRARRLVSSGDSSLYDFSLMTGEQLLLEGQLMVVMQAASGGTSWAGDN